MAVQTEQAGAAPPRSADTAPAGDQLADQAAPLDALLVDGALGQPRGPGGPSLHDSLVAWVMRRGQRPFCLAVRGRAEGPPWRLGDPAKESSADVTQEAHLTRSRPAAGGFRFSEYLTRGDCATVALQYSLRPSFLFLDRVAVGREQNRALLHGLERRLRGLPEGHRPRLVGFGESLGALAIQDAFRHEGVSGLHRAGMDRPCSWAPRRKATGPTVALALETHRSGQ